VGNNVDGIFISNPQYEINDAVTSYIPTINSQVTRPADVITRDNAQDLIGQTEGSVYFEINETFYSSPSNNVDLLSIEQYRNTGSRITIFRSDDYLVVQFKNNSDVVTSRLFSNPSYKKLVVSYNVNFIEFYLNGVKELSLIENNTFILNNILFGQGSSWGGFKPPIMAIKSFATYKTALTESEAIALTTL